MNHKLMLPPWRGDDEIMPARRTLGVKQVAWKLGLSEHTLRTYAQKADRRHLIPPPFRLPGGRLLKWYEDELDAWIAAGRPKASHAWKKRGAPTMRERAEREQRARAGV